jgi:transcriptional regulator with XRE-family HTH domain
MTSLSARIGELLARQGGVRPADIARIAGVSTASVSDWMTGATKSMKPEPARRLSAHFGCDQNWLMTGIGAPNWTDSRVVAPDGGVADHFRPKQTAREALATIRNLMVMSSSDNEALGEALKLMAKVPDSDRAFEQAASLLESLAEGVR